MSQKSFLDNKKSRKNFPYVGRGGGGSTNTWKIPYVSSFLFLKASLKLLHKSQIHINPFHKLSLSGSKYSEIHLFTVYTRKESVSWLMISIIMSVVMVVTVNIDTCCMTNSISGHHLDNNGKYF